MKRAPRRGNTGAALIFAGPWGMVMVNAIAGGGVAANTATSSDQRWAHAAARLTRIIALRGDVQRRVFGSGCVDPRWFCPHCAGATRCVFSRAAFFPYPGTGPCLVACRLQRRPRLFSRSRADADQVQGAQRLEICHAARLGRPRRLVEPLSRSQARLPAQAGGNLEPDGGRGGGELRAGARPHPRSASGAVSYSVGDLHLHPHAHRPGRIRRAVLDRRVRRGSPRRHLHDDLRAAVLRHLGPRRLGQSAPADREQYVRRASQRRRSRQCQAFGAGGARHRLFQSPRRGCAARTARSARSRNTRRRWRSCRTSSTAGYAVSKAMSRRPRRRFSPPRRKRSTSACSARNSSTPSRC